MVDVYLGARIGQLTLTEVTHWMGGTGRRYAGYCCTCTCGARVRIRSEDLRAGRQVRCGPRCAARFPTTLQEWLANTTPNGECMEWQGPATNGYGRVQIAGKPVGVHREVLRLATGVEPLVCMHTCDNPLCINPDHLRAGTPQENTGDMVAKRRHAFGEKHPNRKLSPSDVLEIRAALDAGMSKSKLAKKYAVSRATIYAIQWSRTWKHLDLALKTD